jgi:hypothetical protein
MRRSQRTRRGKKLPIVVVEDHLGVAVVDVGEEEEEDAGEVEVVASKTLFARLGWSGVSVYLQCFSKVVSGTHR